jgi:ubiquitin C-terminal hydrolase
MTKKVGTRKSRRMAGRNKKSPLSNSLSSAYGNHKRSKEDAAADEADDEYCALCELEKHLVRVHHASANWEGSSSSSCAPHHGSASPKYATGGRASSPNYYLTGGTNSTTAPGGPVAPTDFVNGFVAHVAPGFELGFQEDSHEFLRLLIDAMQESCRHARNNKNNNINDLYHTDHHKKKRPRPAVDPETMRWTRTERAKRAAAAAAAALAAQEKAQKAEALKKQRLAAAAASSSHTTNIWGMDPEEENNDDIEYPFRLFRGMVESNVKCSSCQATSSTLDPIEDIGLEVVPSSNNNNSHTNQTKGGPLAEITKALERFTENETLDSEYKCNSCGLLGYATKQSRLASIPPILTLHLKRFRYGDDTSPPAPTTESTTNILSPSIPNTTNINNNNDSSSNTLPSTGSGKASSLVGESSTMATTSTSATATASGTKTTVAAAMPPPPIQRRARSELSQLTVGNSFHGDFVDVLGASAKIEGHVSFHDTLNVQPYVTKALQQKRSEIPCRLFAVIVHAGKNSHSGHYIAYVKSVNKDEWWKMDDARVTKATLEEVTESEAYMLFYRVVDHPISIKLRNMANTKHKSNPQVLHPRHHPHHLRFHHCPKKKRQQRKQVNKKSGHHKKRQILYHRLESPHPLPSYLLRLRPRPRPRRALVQ